MCKEKSCAAKFLIGCIVTVLVIVVVVVSLGSYALFYVPNMEKLTEKLNKNNSITAVVYEDGDFTTKVIEMMGDLGSISPTFAHIDNTSSLKVIELHSANEEDENGAYGVVIYTDSVKTALNVMIDYIKIIMKKSESRELDYHVSCRGNAVFFGNLKAELALRKVIF